MAPAWVRDSRWNHSSALEEHLDIVNRGAGYWHDRGLESSLRPFLVPAYTPELGLFLSDIDDYFRGILAAESVQAIYDNAENLAVPETSHFVARTSYYLARSLRHVDCERKVICFGFVARNKKPLALANQYQRSC